MSEYGAAGVLAESQRCMPKTAYGIGKPAAGLYALSLRSETGRPRHRGAAFRRLWRRRGRHCSFRRCCANCRPGRPVALSDGLQRRDFIHVDDAGRAMLALAARAPRLMQNWSMSAPASPCRCATSPNGWPTPSARRASCCSSVPARARPATKICSAADIGHLATLVGSAPPQRLAEGLPLSLFEE